MTKQIEMTSHMRVEDFPGAELQADGSVIIDMGELVEFHLHAIGMSWDDVNVVRISECNTLITVEFAKGDEDDLIITLTPPKSEFN